MPWWQFLVRAERSITVFPTIVWSCVWNFQSQKTEGKNTSSCIVDQLFLVYYMEVDKVCTSMLFDNQHSSAETRRQSMFNCVSSFYSSSYGHVWTQRYSFFVAGNSCCRDPSYNRYCGGGSGSTGGGGWPTKYIEFKMFMKRYCLCRVWYMHY